MFCVAAYLCEIKVCIVNSSIIWLYLF